jgi:hypothetical protein
VPLLGAPHQGKLSGVVVDPAGVPQMGATVWIVADDARSPGSKQAFTNERGSFAVDPLRPGLYSVRVTLAGFLPAIERNVRIEPNLTTLLRIELDSVFSSVDRLRRRPPQPVEQDEWLWVLRTSPATRPVLRWLEGEVLLEGEAAESEIAHAREPQGRIEVTVGARRPGSTSNIVDAPASSFAYEQHLGGISRLLMAGQVSYERSAAAGFVSTWVPSGEADGPRTTLVLRQTNLGPNGPAFRGIRVDHENQLQLGERLQVRYGGEYLLVSLHDSASSIRPRAEVTYTLSPRWRATLSTASLAGPGSDPGAGPLEATLQQLDSLPALLLRNGRPVMEGGWHQEFSLDRSLGPNASLIASVFRDRSRHTPVFGRGAAEGADFLQAYYSDAFAYDGGESNCWGTRVAYRQRFSEDFEATVVYAWAGALELEELAGGAALRDTLETRNSHSLAARVSTRVPKLGTRISASYKWISSPVVSRQDTYGEMAYQLDPNLNLSVRQPLPNFFSAGRFEALVDFRNVLAQGYVPVSTRDGQFVLVPAFRSLRGGFSFQF